MHPLEAGQKFERYRIIRRLGSGISGETYLAEDMLLRQRITLKLIHPWSIPSDAARRQFFREIQGISELSHPGFAPILDYGEAGGQLYMTRRYISHGSLLNTEGRTWFRAPLAIAQAISYLYRLAQALHYIHVSGYFHGSLSFSNILVVSNPNNETETETAPLLIADVGTAHFVRRFGRSPIPFLPITAAPEQLGKRTTYASDQYALAVLLYFWFTGRPPFLGTSDEIEEAKLSGTVTVASSLNPHVSPVLDVILQRALNVYPEERYPSVLTFAEALQKSLKTTSNELLLPESNGHSTSIITTLTNTFTNNSSPDSSPDLPQIELDIPQPIPEPEFPEPLTESQPETPPEPEPLPEPQLIVVPEPQQSLAPIPHPDTNPLSELDEHAMLKIRITQPLAASESELELPVEPVARITQPLPAPEPMRRITQPLVALDDSTDESEVPEPQPPITGTVATPEESESQPLPTGVVAEQEPFEASPDTDEIVQGLSEPQPLIAEAKEDQVSSLPLLIITPPYSQETREVVLEQDRITLGRAGSSDILLDQDNLTSRHHALLQRTGTDVTITDQRSLHGVFVNGQKLESEVAHPLSDKDTITIGTYTLTFLHKVPQQTAIS